MKFTSEDLMKAMGLSVGDRIKITMQFYGGLVKTGIYEVTKYGNLQCLPNQNKKDLIEFDGCKIDNLIGEAVEYEILPKPKRVGDLKCNDFECNDCPLKYICCLMDWDFSLNNSLYNILELFNCNDQEIYDLLKSRLNCVVE